MLSQLDIRLACQQVGKVAMLYLVLLVFVEEMNDQGDGKITTKYNKLFVYLVLV